MYRDRGKSAVAETNQVLINRKLINVPEIEIGEVVQSIYYNVLAISQYITFSTQAVMLCACATQETTRKTQNAAQDRTQGERGT